MPTAGRLIDETLGLLQSQDDEQVTTLSANFTAGALTFTVTTVRAGAMGISPGIVEIDSELVFVSAVDPGGVCTIEPFGRGYNGTTAAAHTAGAKVTSQPAYPRAKVLDALNETALRVFPNLFWPKVSTFTTTVPVITYDLPDEAVWVLDAQWLPPTGTGQWVSLQRWKVRNGGTTVAADPGVSVDVSDCVIPGQPIAFTYAAKPGQFGAETDDFVAATGLPLSAKDLIVTGAAAGNLVASQELSRLQTSSVEQQNRAALVAPSAALTSSRYLEAKFQQRLAEEKAALRRKWPIRIARSWT